MNIQDVTSSLSGTVSGWDILVAVVFMGGVLFYSLGLGRDRVFIVLISTYISLALFEKSGVIFKTAGFQVRHSFVNDTIIFLAVILFSFFVLSNSVFTSVFDQSPKGTWLQTLTISFLQIGLTISIIVSFFSPEKADTLSFFMKSVFVENGAQSFWLLAPFAAMVLLRIRIF